LSTFFFDFGDDLVGDKQVHTAVVVTNTGKNTLTMDPALTGDPSYSIVAAHSCGAQLAAGKSCDMVLRYVPAKPSYPRAQRATLKMNFGNAEPGDPETVAITGVSAVLKPGTVSLTNNPQVALYTMTLPFGGRMRVYFGPSQSYGRKTSFQSTDENNGQVSVFVAGMIANTTYHMAAQVELPNGIVTMDTDHTFAVPALPTQWQINLKATTASGKTPQPGIELINPETPTNGLAAVDLQGNIIWTYTAADTPGDNLDGAKLLPNGDIALVLSPLSTEPLSTPLNPSAYIWEIREINLAGDTVREVSIADLNAELASATCAECSNLTLLTFHHDVTPLPNGHWIVLSNAMMGLSPTSKPPLTNYRPINVLGDVIVDLDENLQPVWVWNEFNHLDPNRHPYEFPDWTHTNAILYSQSDHNLIVSIRHQNWVVKVNYKDGEGDGSIVWRLGEGGNFKLIGGTDPTDWQYAQHGPNFFSPNTSGVFELGLMDNGDDRLYPASNKTCADQGNLPASCLYSTIPVFKIDETTMTASLVFHQKQPADRYSFFGGNTDLLANGNVEYDLAGVGTNAYVNEVTRETNPQPVWNLTLTGGWMYRAFRVPSLYPGVQW